MKFCNSIKNGYSLINYVQVRYSYIRRIVWLFYTYENIPIIINSKNHKYQIYQQTNILTIFNPSTNENSIRLVRQCISAICVEYKQNRCSNSSREKKREFLFFPLINQLLMIVEIKRQWSHEIKPIKINHDLLITMLSIWLVSLVLNVDVRHLLHQYQLNSRIERTIKLSSLMNLMNI